MSDGLAPDFVILADAAQVQGDKLYLLGGGWTMIWVKEFPAQHQMAVAAGILVPWLETNAKHNFRILVRAEDGATFTDVGGEFEQGRPPGLPPGTTQRVMFTVNMGIRIERPVEAAAELWIDGALARSVPFRIVETPR
jgi:Family of unknown function (DUF6941)